jgi:hypothetical protein
LCKSSGALPKMTNSKDIVCDFCKSPEVKWRYPCKDFEMPAHMWKNVGHWAACEPCHAIIEAGNVYTLAALITAREIDEHKKDIPTEFLEETMVWMYASLIELYLKFQMNRTGPCVPV